MATDEQRVRTMAGWIGVEISKSRARKRGNPDYGLWRVRGSERYADQDSVTGQWTEPGAMRPTGWTAYAFTLEAIGAAVESAIVQSRPAAPGALKVAGRRFDVGDLVATVPTRWTPAYRGRRDLGVLADTSRCTHEIGQPCPVGASMGEHAHEASGCDMGGRPHPGPCRQAAIGEGVLRETPQSRQRAQNAEFHAEHTERRKHGLARRHAEKLRHNARRPTGIAVERLTGAPEGDGNGPGFSGPQI